VGDKFLMLTIINFFFFFFTRSLGSFLPVGIVGTLYNFQTTTSDKMYERRSENVIHSIVEREREIIKVIRVILSKRRKIFFLFRFHLSLSHCAEDNKAYVV
jgi:hypothetical protein